MLARKWLFLRACGHLLNARDRGNAKHLRGALILEFRKSASTPPDIFLIVFLTSNRIIFIISITVIFVVLSISITTVFNFSAFIISVFISTTILFIRSVFSTIIFDSFTLLFLSVLYLLSHSNSAVPLEPSI